MYRMGWDGMGWDGMEWYSMYLCTCIHTVRIHIYIYTVYITGRKVTGPWLFIGPKDRLINRLAHLIEVLVSGLGLLDFQGMMGYS